MWDRYQCETGANVRQVPMPKSGNTQADEGGQIRHKLVAALWSQ